MKLTYWVLLEAVIFILALFLFFKMAMLFSGPLGF